MRNVVRNRFNTLKMPASMGAVTDVRFIRCFWPKLDIPTAIFAKGSSGLRVIGSPTPRNVVFPADTIFEPYYPDAEYPAEVATVLQFKLQQFVNLTDEQSEFYAKAFDLATQSVIAEERNATILQTRSDCHFLRHKESLGTRTGIEYFDDGPFETREEFLAFKTADFGCLDITKSPHYSNALAEWVRGPRKVRSEAVTKERFAEYIAELTPEHVEAIVSGKVDHEDLKTELPFVHISESLENPDAKTFRVAVVDGKAAATEVGTVKDALQVADVEVAAR